MGRHLDNLMPRRALDMHPGVMLFRPLGPGNSLTQPCAWCVRLDCIMVMVCIIVRGGGRDVRQT